MQLSITPPHGRPCSPTGAVTKLSNGCATRDSGAPKTNYPHPTSELSHTRRVRSTCSPARDPTSTASGSSFVRKAATKSTSQERAASSQRCSTSSTSGYNGSPPPTAPPKSACTHPPTATPDKQTASSPSTAPN